ncbi:MAG: hypothetical protein O2999_15000 [Nitrospirae bacterium]|nr:hypothetical protein [Nitrospirota bacterium]MDA1305568.1 hypothetical protein [Nitrospirota bacterium]
MPKSKELNEDPGTWIFRDIPRDLMWRAKAAAAIQGKSVKGLVIELMEEHLKEMEKKGLWPKGK